MVKAQVISMQSVAALRSWCSVKVIIIKRAADMCHMYAYLVGTASVQLQFQQTEMFPAAQLHWIIADVPFGETQRSIMLPSFLEIGASIMPLSAGNVPVTIPKYFFMTSCWESRNW
jgi:hypothetical protein